MKKIATTLFFLAVCFPLMSQSTYSDRTGPDHSFPKMRVAVDVGGTYRLGKADPGMKEIINKLRPGFKVEGDIHGFVSKKIGLGAKIAGRFHSASQSDVDIKMTTLYFAPSFIFRWQASNRKDFWVWGYSLGYVDYSEKASNWARTEKINKSAFGSSLDIGYDVRVANKTFWGFKFSLFTGSVAFENDNSSTLNALELSTGIRF